MATKRSRRETGRQRGHEVETRVLHELRTARTVANLSQQSLAAVLGWSQGRYSKFERGLTRSAVHEVCEVASALGLEVSLTMRRTGEGVRDAGQVRLVNRFCQLLSDRWSVLREAPFPRLGDLRSWDVLLRMPEYLVGVEAETRLRDQQELVRRIRQRELHGGVNAILVLLSDSGHNRLLVEELRAALGPTYATPASQLTAAFRDGRRLPGSGVILL